MGWCRCVGVFVCCWVGITDETTGQKIASDSVVAITVIITVAAMWYINRQMALAKPAVIYARRKARCAPISFTLSLLVSPYPV